MSRLEGERTGDERTKLTERIKVRVYDLIAAILACSDVLYIKSHELDDPKEIVCMHSKCTILAGHLMV